MEVTGNEKVGKGSFTPNTQLPRPVQRGNYEIKKHDTQKRPGYPKSSRKGPDLEEGRREPRDN